jgi:L-ascorbate metabolism protein UlaG (beta-lactamase superfamily)
VDWAGILAITGLLASGCASHKPLPLHPGEATPAQPADLEVEWTGVGAFFLRHGDIAVLTDPFWSHYPVARAGFGTLPPDPEQIEPWVSGLDQVRAVLIGHGHYDHVSDLPYVAPRLHPEAVVLASQTVAHTFAPLDLPVPILPVNDLRGDEANPGTWVAIADGRARVLPLRSGHPNQWLFFHLWTRRLTEDRHRPPRRVGHFQEGETLAFLIDFLDVEGGIRHRAYIQTSSTGLPAGAVSPEVLDEHPVDVALMAMDVANYAADGKPTVLDQLGAPLVIFCHWEDFFRRKDQPPREIVKVDLHRLREALQDTEEVRYVFPAWGARFVVEAP